MSPRTMAERKARERQRLERRDTLELFLARIGQLTPAELLLFVDYVRGELVASDHLRDTSRGLQTALQAAHDQTRAAEATIVELERDRDAAIEVVRLLLGARLVGLPAPTVSRESDAA